MKISVHFRGVIIGGFYHFMVIVMSKEVKKNRFLSFCLLIFFLLLCSIVTIVLLTQRGTLTRLLRCFEKSCEVHRKFSRVVSPKVSLKRTLFVRIFQPDFEFHFFKNSTFFALPNMRFDWCVVWSRFFY